MPSQRTIFNQENGSAAGLVFITSLVVLICLPFSVLSNLIAKNLGGGVNESDSDIAKIYAIAFGFGLISPLSVFPSLSAGFIEKHTKSLLAGIAAGTVSLEAALYFCLAVSKLAFMSTKEQSSMDRYENFGTDIAKLTGEAHILPGICLLLYGMYAGGKYLLSAKQPAAASKHEPIVAMEEGKKPSRVEKKLPDDEDAAKPSQTTAVAMFATTTPRPSSSIVAQASEPTSEPSTPVVISKPTTKPTTPVGRDEIELAEAFGGASNERAFTAA